MFFLLKSKKKEELLYIYIYGAMLLKLDGNSEICCARKEQVVYVIWSVWGILLDQEQSHIWSFFQKKNYFSSCLRSMFLVTIKYKDHDMEHNVHDEWRAPSMDQ